MEKTHVYPAKPIWQWVHCVLGFWAWLCVFASIVGTLFVLLIFKWARKVIPAFRRVMAGEPRSYLRVSEAGLIYRIFPLGEIRCGWDDVECIHSDRWFGDRLYLRQAEMSGFREFAIHLNRPQIHLNSLVGWSDGKLRRICENMRTLKEALAQELINPDQQGRSIPAKRVISILTR